MKITTTQTAYMSSAYDMGRFVDALSKGDHEDIAGRAHFARMGYERQRLDKSRHCSHHH